MKRVFIIMASMALITCGTGESGIDTTPPVLTVAPVNITIPYNPVTATCGVVNSIYPFGVALGPDRYSPAFEYITVPDADVMAASDGIVTMFFLNDGSADYEIHIAPNANSSWVVGYDHVVNPTVSLGDIVSAGDVLGQAGLWGMDTRRTELQVNNVGKTHLAFCPLDFGTTEFNDLHNSMFQELVSNDVINYPSLCLLNSVDPTKATSNP